MRIVARYSFNGGEDAVSTKFPTELAEIEEAISSIDASKHRTKESKEKTMRGRMLYSPSSLNKAFKKRLFDSGWVQHKVMCNYPTAYYVDGYKPQITEDAFREMDFVKNGLGVEVQFGKYSFMVYNVAAKMTIFRNLGVIRAGIEVVPVKAFTKDPKGKRLMSTGVSYFEQFAWDLEKRGISDIDVPVLILGIDRDA